MRDIYEVFLNNNQLIKRKKKKVDVKGEFDRRLIRKKLSLHDATICSSA